MIETVALIVLALTNLGTLGAFGFYIYLENKEKAKTINALIAKNSKEYLDHEMADKIQEVKTEPPIELPSEFVEESAMSDEEFDKKVVNSS